MKYNFCSIRTNVTKYKLTFAQATRGEGKREQKTHANATDYDCTLQ